MDCECMKFLAYASLAYLALKFGLCILGGLYRTFLCSPTDVKKLGQWALVTGSTDGIGKAYARALAKKGLNIILVSRSPFKLQNVAAEIEDEFRVKAKIVDIDFTSDADDYRNRLEKELKDFEIGVLVNNVGMSYEYPEYFTAVPDGDKRIADLVKVNVTALNTLTRIVLPDMVARKKGAIINISSMSCMIPSPLLSVYAGTKAYVDVFTQGLELEYAKQGLIIQCVLPGYVVSNMSGLKKSSFIAPTPKQFVDSALNRLGVYSRTTGYWTHDLMAGFINALPFGLDGKVAFDQLKAIRAKALKKRAKEQ